MFVMSIMCYVLCVAPLGSCVYVYVSVCVCMCLMCVWCVRVCGVCVRACVRVCVCVSARSTASPRFLVPGDAPTEWVLYSGQKSPRMGTGSISEKPLPEHFRNTSGILPENLLVFFAHASGLYIHTPHTTRTPHTKHSNKQHTITATYNKRLPESFRVSSGTSASLPEHTLTNMANVTNIQTSSGEKLPESSGMRVLTSAFRRVCESTSPYLCVC
jgi:hypothetical protein